MFDDTLYCIWLKSSKKVEAVKLHHDATSQHEYHSSQKVGFRVVEPIFGVGLT